MPLTWMNSEALPNLLLSSQIASRLVEGSNYVLTTAANTARSPTPAF